MRFTEICFQLSVEKPIPTKLRPINVDMAAMQSVLTAKNRRTRRPNTPIFVLEFWFIFHEKNRCYFWVSWRGCEVLTCPLLDRWILDSRAGQPVEWSICSDQLILHFENESLDLKLQYWLINRLITNYHFGCFGSTGFSTGCVTFKHRRKTRKTLVTFLPGSDDLVPFRTNASLLSTMKNMAIFTLVAIEKVYTRDLSFFSNL